MEQPIDGKISDKEEVFQVSKTVYGPVKSWRFGQSLGIDPLFYTSTCSFNCIYCQLGHIQNITTEFKDYVSTAKVLEDYRVAVAGQEVDWVMFSGSGEPTLAKNLGDISGGIKQLSPPVPQAILTNGVHLGLPEVQRNLRGMDKVIIKLDAPSERVLRLVNRPAAGVSWANIMAAIHSFQQSYRGELEIQVMLMPINRNAVDELCQQLKKINPHRVQLNTPQRAYPLGWHRENRGNHCGIHDHKTAALKTLESAEMRAIEEVIVKQTGLSVLSIYGD